MVISASGRSQDTLQLRSFLSEHILRRTEIVETFKELFDGNLPSLSYVSKRTLPSGTVGKTRQSLLRKTCADCIILMLRRNALGMLIFVEAERSRRCTSDTNSVLEMVQIYFCS